MKSLQDFMMNEATDTRVFVVLDIANESSKFVSKTEMISILRKWYNEDYDFKRQDGQSIDTKHIYAMNIGTCIESNDEKYAIIRVK